MTKKKEISDHELLKRVEESKKTWEEDRCRDSSLLAVLQWWVRGGKDLREGLEFLEEGIDSTRIRRQVFQDPFIREVASILRGDQDIFCAQARETAKALFGIESAESPASDEPCLHERLEQERRAELPSDEEIEAAKNRQADLEMLVNSCIVFADRHGKVVHKASNSFWQLLEMRYEKDGLTIYFRVQNSPYGNGSAKVEVADNGTKVLDASGNYIVAAYNIEADTYVPGDWEVPIREFAKPILERS